MSPQDIFVAFRFLIADRKRELLEQRSAFPPDPSVQGTILDQRFDARLSELDELAQRFGLFGFQRAGVDLVLHIEPAPPTRKAVGQ